jgi:hypothetical protein
MRTGGLSQGADCTESGSQAPAGLRVPTERATVRGHVVVAAKKSAICSVFGVPRADRAWHRGWPAGTGGGVSRERWLDLGCTDSEM